MEFRKLKKKDILIMILVFGSFYLFFIFIFPFFTKNRDMEIEKSLTTFYKSKISNTVVDIKQRGKGHCEFITNDNNKYYCYLFFYSESGHHLYDVAEKGDSIYKPANSDTLYLFKKLRIPLKDKKYQDPFPIYVNPKYHCIETN